VNKLKSARAHQELDIMITKEPHNYTKQTINIAVGIFWILAAALVVGTIVLSLIYFRIWRKRSRNLNPQQEQPTNRIHLRRRSNNGHSDNSARLCFDMDHLSISFFLVSLFSYLLMRMILSRIEDLAFRFVALLFHSITVPFQKISLL